MTRTRRYCAPEVYAEESRGRSADVFSLECIFLEIVTVVQDFQLDEFAEFRSHITDPREEERDYSFHGNLENVSHWIDKVSVAWAKEQSRRGMTSVWKQGVIRRMLLKNPEERPTASTVLEELGGARDCCAQEQEVFEAEF